MYSFNIDPALQEFEDDYGNHSLSYDQSNDGMYFYTNSSINNSDTKSFSCSVESLLTSNGIDERFNVTIFSQEVTNTSCNVVFKFVSKDSQDSQNFTYTAIEVMYFEDSRGYVEHNFIGTGNTTDEEFIYFVNQTLNTTKLK